MRVGLHMFFSNIFENIDGLVHFRIREYSREYRCPGRLFSQEYTSFLQPLTLVDLESQDILEYVSTLHRGVYRTVANGLLETALLSPQQ